MTWKKVLQSSSSILIGSAECSSRCLTRPMPEFAVKRVVDGERLGCQAGVSTLVSSLRINPIRASAFFLETVAQNAQGPATHDDDPAVKLGSSEGVFDVLSIDYLAPLVSAR